MTFLRTYNIFLHPLGSITLRLRKLKICFFFNSENYEEWADDESVNFPVAGWFAKRNSFFNLE